MKYGKDIRKRLDPLMEKHGYKLYEDDSYWVFYVNLEKSYPQTFDFQVEWHMQEVYSTIEYNRLISREKNIIRKEHYTSKEDLLNKLDNDWIYRIEEALNKQWIKPGIDFLDGTIDEDVFNNYKQYAQEVLSSKDYPFNNINDVRYIINDLLSQKLSFKDFMKKASSVYIKYVLEADNEFNDFHMGDNFGLKRNIYISNGKKGTKYFKSINVLDSVVYFWYFGDNDLLEFGKKFYWFNLNDDVEDTFNSEDNQYLIKLGEFSRILT